MKTKPKQKTIKAYAVVFDNEIVVDFMGAADDAKPLIFLSKKQAKEYIGDPSESVRPVTITIE